MNDGIHPSVAAVTGYDWRRDLRRRVLLPWGRKYEHPLGRGAFVAAVLCDCLPGSVLDVGSGRSSEYLKQTLGEAYHSLDLASSYQFRRPSANTMPDAVIDLERGELPFDDKAFDTVICTDVLEHVDNIYRAYDELFRVARRYVIISLPNNWPKLIGSFLIGRNVTHRAGYGLPPQPKPAGQRHKYFFNFEEACEFLGGRVPAGFRVCRFDQRFEYGNDGLLCFLSPVSLSVRAIQMGRPFAMAREHYGVAVGTALAAIALTAYPLLRLLDVSLSVVGWGWGPKVRFYNLFCRQVWMVYERIEQSPGDDHG
jgi:SAM-dependent methyltransferase